MLIVHEPYGNTYVFQAAFCTVSIQKNNNNFPYGKELPSSCRDGTLSRSEYSSILCGNHGYRLRFIHVCESDFPQSLFGKD